MAAAVRADLQSSATPFPRPESWGWRSCRASPLLVGCKSQQWRPRVQALPSFSRNRGGRQHRPGNAGSGSTRSSRLRSRRIPRAMQADDLPPPTEMTYESALGLLGVSDGASFDDILRAKRTKLEAVGEDADLALRIEAAYDILLMQSLSRRRAGKVIDSSVKYADVKKPQPPSPPPAWWQAVTRTTTLTVAKPSNQEIATRAAVFGALAAWTYIGGLSDPASYSQYGGPQAGADVPGLQLALGLGASIYFLPKDNVGLGRAVLVSATALTSGGLFGGFVDSWIRVDIFPFLGISSPAVLIGEFSTLTLSLACIFLR